MNVLEGALAGKVAVITGATSGIGAATAAMFVAAGASVIIGGRRKDVGEAFAAELGPRARFVPADVRVESEVEALIATATDEFGRLDALVNNAGLGVSRPLPLPEADLAAFLDTLAVHAGGMLLGIKYAARAMIPRGAGSIINMSSIGGHRAGWSDVSYSTAKAGVLQLTRSAAVELGTRGIRVNSISPGPIPTGIFAKNAGVDAERADRTAPALEPLFLQALENHQSIRRVGRVEDVAAAALWLASDASSFVTGQDIGVDGGIAAGRPVSVAAEERRLLAEAFASLPG
ncbi:SDR family oxidoreductase [Frankia sp. CNm7]|uniref:SDR family oxidoreductase n=1 Tax=Frankia nepalensis TaxID=1836974 RepID=A0A937UNB2_9ACTN|nr:SDR family oxidoreductase [Frankia nepalensis]MBL7500513.1 SDR family oxidoreductase [Frankia nepalensis]MBL7509793.1 SDR family oxidoreductase [Frankia nepalensis]MBL7522191.1 SDR family oxidoreductase [Frankia nepalensis]MBL7627913.1 SDR family oxidoreductase [Frankia nepalensis]